MSTGPSCAGACATSSSDRYIYIVLTTGLDHPEHVLEGMSAGADDYLIKPVDSFAVQTRLVAAERVTALHRKLAPTQAELEQANLELLEQSLHRRADRTGQPPPDGGGPGPHPRPGNAGRPDLRHRALRHRPLQALQRPLRAPRRRRDAPPCGGDASTWSMRAGECAYRYGGEEFLLLMPDCRPTDSIFITGERIRQAVVEVDPPRRPAVRPTLRHA